MAKQESGAARPPLDPSDWAPGDPLREEARDNGWIVAEVWSYHPIHDDDGNVTGVEQEMNVIVGPFETELEAKEYNAWAARAAALTPFPLRAASGVAQMMYPPDAWWKQR